MVINKMEVQCKCHGVSGSCEMRTCWRSLPKFRNLGAHLQERFHEAIQVTYLNNRLVSMKALEQLKNDLIYTSESPTFCHHDPRYGSIGTYGRQCDENSQGLNSCFKRQTFVQQERCDCKFQWCCKVVCKTCRKTVVISTCN
ncbi:unnamed protein product [Trichobilharzia regenti]|nr:unnamed protein product [Trichobilharzia regenti]